MVQKSLYSRTTWYTARVCLKLNPSTRRKNYLVFIWVNFCASYIKFVLYFFKTKKTASHSIFQAAWDVCRTCCSRFLVEGYWPATAPARWCQSWQVRSYYTLCAHERRVLVLPVLLMFRLHLFLRMDTKWRVNLYLSMLKVLREDSKLTRDCHLSSHVENKKKHQTASPLTQPPHPIVPALL